MSRVTKRDRRRIPTLRQAEEWERCGRCAHCRPKHLCRLHDAAVSLNWICDDFRQAREEPRAASEWLALVEQTRCVEAGPQTPEDLDPGAP